MKIKHVTLRVRNLEKSIQFYETITELGIARSFKSGSAEIAFMTNGEGETEIELLYIPEGQTFEGKGMFICFETDKLEEMHKLAQDKGFNPLQSRTLAIKPAIFMCMIQMGYLCNYDLFQSNYCKSWKGTPQR